MRHSPAPQALILGPVFTTALVGGLPLALADVVEQLRAHGWDVDDRLWATPPQDAVAWRTTVSHSRLSLLQRWPLLLDVWLKAVPLPLRRRLSTLWMPRAYYQNVAHNLDAATQLLATQRYDVVLVCVDGAPPGLSALVAASDQRACILVCRGWATSCRRVGGAGRGTRRAFV